MMRQSEEYRELVEADSDYHDPSLDNSYRLFCYGFRSGGFADATRTAIQELIESAATPDARDYLSGAVVCLDEMLDIRAKSVPSDDADAALSRRFDGYRRNINDIVEKLSAAQEAERKNEGIAKASRIFVTAMERITNSTGLCIINFDDEALLDHGAMDLAGPGLKDHAGAICQRSGATFCNCLTAKLFLP